MYNSDIKNAYIEYKKEITIINRSFQLCMKKN